MRLLAALLLIALAACDAPTPAQIKGQAGVGQGGGQPGQVAAQVVRAALGGTVASPGGASVSIPAGAVDKDVHVALREAPAESHASEGVRVLGKVWSFTVDGADHYRFAKPVRLELPFDPAGVTADAPVGLSVWKDGRWEGVPGARAEGSRVVAEVDHFSDYAPTQDHSSAPDRTHDDIRKRFLENESWYGSVHITMRGAGHRSDSGTESERSYTISRTGEAEFRIKAMLGEAATAAALEQMKKRSLVSLPPELMEQFEKTRDVRHWLTSPVNRAPGDETDYVLSVSDRYDAKDPDWGEGGRMGPDTVTHRTLQGGDSGKCAATHMLEIDVGKGTYSLGVSDLVAGKKLELIETVTGEPGDKASAPAVFGWQLRDRRLPASGNVISETMPIPRKQWDRFIPDLGSWEFDYGTVSGTITWTLSPTPFEDVELVLTPTGYKDWLPRGGRDEATKGDKPLEMTATLRRRGGGGTKARLKDIVIELREVSRVRGVCLNRPLQPGGGEPEPDLKLASTAGVKIDRQGTHLEKKGEFSEVPFEVECYDWGAWGAVVAHGTLTDGRPVWATLDGDPSVEEVRLPERDPSSKVANKWKQEMKVEGRADTEDADEQKGNPNKGDGLTLYEEYRGLVAKGGKHTREPPAPGKARSLSPLTKDLIVENRMKQRAEPGLLLFEKASHIHVVELAEGELPGSRLVNMNVDRSLSAGEQYGLLLFDAPGEGAGFTEGAPGGTPKRYTKVTVNLAGAAGRQRLLAIYGGRRVPVPFGLEEEIATTVAHELAHGVGVAEHGVDATVNLVDRELKKDPPPVYDPAGKKITTRPYTIDGAVGEVGGSSSGDVRCLMTYNNVFVWAYHPGEGYYASPVLGKGTIFCTGPEGPTPNPFGAARPGNCLKAMKVKDN